MYILNCHSESTCTSCSPLTRPLLLLCLQVSVVDGQLCWEHSVAGYHVHLHTMKQEERPEEWVSILRIITSMHRDAFTTVNGNK